MDELVEYLHRAAPENIIIGEDDCNLLILGDGSQTPAAVKMLLFAVGCTGSITEETIHELRGKYLHNPVFRQLFDCGKKMASIAEIPFIMIGYQKWAIDGDVGKQIETMKFMARKICPEDKKEKPIIFASDEFVSYLYGQIGMDWHGSGTHKEENKRLADIFHVWSRSKLSAQLVKQDFDAIYADQDRFAMIEVKRSPARTVRAWSPYRNDSRNYDIQNQFAKIIKAPFFTFHHNGGTCGDATRIGCYKILDVNTNEKTEWIKYQKSIIRAGQIIGILKGKEKE